ncbi:hypothetical protein SCP_0409410 [Sparassis crispa]|uniref:Kinetochore protein n=1 Tax=Sparassis crispa TaxID=139825 RepID=A0A401GK60_9APHY|nr:hypothetical protein SCP_0409410 [Sparassis crispa]GBE82557.1 hypothetical protein SCP_0409410 [Sparassis crispa]
MDAQREDITRISVDTLQDWQRVKANFTDAALTVLDEQLAARTSSLDRDVLREYVQRFVERTFEMTKPNVRINGRNYEELDEDEQEEEPFDEGFDRHIWSLSEQSLKWDRELADKRREKPREVERLVHELIESRRAAEDASFPEDVDGLEDEGPKEDVPDTTYENSEQVSREVYAISEELKQSVPVQLERSERVRNVATEIKSLKL